jgi:hypothetical protein
LLKSREELPFSSIQISRGHASNRRICPIVLYQCLERTRYEHHAVVVKKGHWCPQRFIMQIKCAARDGSGLDIPFCPWESVAKESQGLLRIGC